MYYIDLNDKQKSYIYSKCIVKHIKEKYKYDLSPDEQTFLCIHIKRVMG